MLKTSQLTYNIQPNKSSKDRSVSVGNFKLQYTTGNSILWTSGLLESDLCDSQNHLTYPLQIPHDNVISQSWFFSHS